MANKRTNVNIINNLRQNVDRGGEKVDERASDRVTGKI